MASVVKKVTLIVSRIKLHTYPVQICNHSARYSWMQLSFSHSHWLRYIYKKYLLIIFKDHFAHHHLRMKRSPARTIVFWLSTSSGRIRITPVLSTIIIFTCMFFVVLSSLDISVFTWKERENCEHRNRNHLSSEGVSWAFFSILFKLF